MATANNTIKTRVQLKSDTEANWNNTSNFIPLNGEFIIYSADNTHPFCRLKVGDGQTKVKYKNAFIWFHILHVIRAGFGIYIWVKIPKSYHYIESMKNFSDEKLSKTLFNDLVRENIDLQIIPIGNTINHCLSLQSYFNQNITCEVNYDERSFKAKMREANKREIPYIIVVGEDEEKTNKYNLKNMQTGESQLLTKEEILKVIQK